MRPFDNSGVINLRGTPYLTHARSGMFLGVIGRLCALFIFMCFFSLLFAVPQTPTALAADPKLVWKTIQTEHFSVHYPVGAEEIARKSANIAEEAHDTLAAFFFAPETLHTNIVLTDPGDGSNGYASVSPYHQITLLAFHPGPDSDLGDADDYLRMLIFHEYTHILHLIMADGIPGFLNDYLGLGILPHNNLPNWFIEGLATWVETQTTGGGRNHRGFFEMYLRTATLFDKIPSFAQLAGTPHDQPRRTGWYAFGGSFVSFLVDNYGEERLREFLRLYSRRLLPLGFNAIAKQTFGSTWEDMEATWHRDLRIRYGRWKTLQAQDNVLIGQPVTTQGEFQRNPALSPLGNLMAYRSSSGETIGTLRIRNLTTGADTIAVTCQGGCGRPVFSPDGQSIFYTKSERFQTVYSFDDLYRYDLNTQKIDRLTWGRRAHDPTVAPDGKSLVFATSHYGRAQLIRRDLTSGAETILLAARGLRQVAHPTFSPDGQRVVFTMHDNNVWDLYSVDTNTHDVERLTHDDAADMTPTFTPDGQFIVYASSAETGPNLFVLDLQTKQRRQLTRSLTGALDPATDGKRVIFGQYSMAGWDLWEIPFPDPEFFKAPHHAEVRDGTTIERPGYVAKNKVYPESDYNPLWTLYPATWTPEFRFVSPDDITAALLLTGTDAVQLHAWSLAAQWNVNNTYPSVAFAYRNQQFIPSIGLSVAWFRRPRVAFDAFSIEIFEEDVALGSMDIGLSFPNSSGSFGTNLQLDVSKSFAVDSPKIEPDPAAGIPYIPRGATTLAITMSWRYDNRESFYYSISPESGRRIGTSLRLSTPTNDSNRLTYTARWQWNEYLAMPYARAHVLAVRYDGGISGGDPDRREGFRLGGIPERDLIEDILEERGLAAGLLRGFNPDAFRGDQIHLLNIEYRFPIWYLHNGISGLPVFLERLHGAIFVDAGTATLAGIFDDPWQVGLGAELRLGAQFLLDTPANFRLGIAHGLGEFGIFQYYLIAGTGF